MSRIHGHWLLVSLRLLTVLFLRSLILLPPPVPLSSQFFPSVSHGIRRGLGPMTSNFINNHLLHFFFVLVGSTVAAAIITICISAPRTSSFAGKWYIRLGSRRACPWTLWARWRRGSRALSMGVDPHNGRKPKPKANGAMVFRIQLVDLPLFLIAKHLLAIKRKRKKRTRFNRLGTSRYSTPNDGTHPHTSMTRGQKPSSRTPSSRRALGTNLQKLVPLGVVSMMMRFGGGMSSRMESLCRSGTSSPARAVRGSKDAKVSLESGDRNTRVGWVGSRRPG